MFTYLLLAATMLPLGPFCHSGREQFDLVSKLGSTIQGVPEQVQKQLTDSPSAALAVLLGRQSSNPEISRRCELIVKEWQDSAQLATVIREYDGDFDRFVNSLLYPPGRDVDPFSQVAEVGRVLDRFMVKKKLPSFIEPKSPLMITPFWDYETYVQRGFPKKVTGYLKSSAVADSSAYLARCEGATVASLTCSILISDGKVEIGTCVYSIVVGGSNVTVSTTAASIIIAAGDVTFSPKGGQTIRALVLCGGKVERRNTERSLFVSPTKIGLPTGPQFQPIVVLDAKPRPAPELFVFRDLSRDFGVDASANGGRVAIVDCKLDSPFAKILRKGDIIIGSRKSKVESLGQFRRLLSYSLDIGQFDFEVERSGSQSRVVADLPKGQR